MLLCPLITDPNSIKILVRCVFFNIINTININILLNIQQYDDRNPSIITPKRCCCAEWPQSCATFSRSATESFNDNTRFVLYWEITWYKGFRLTRPRHSPSSICGAWVQVASKRTLATWLQLLALEFCKSYDRVLVKINT